MASKMYTITTWEENNQFDPGNKFYHAEIKIVFPDEVYSMRDTKVYFVFQADEKSMKQYNNSWYASRIKTECKDIDGIKFISKVMQYFKEDSLSSNPFDIISILESKGYQEANYNKLSSQYETEKEWQTGNSYTIRFPGHEYGYTSVIANDEQQAVKKARKIASQEIESGRNLNNWSNWISQECKVKFNERGEEWNSCKEQLNLEQQKDNDIEEVI